MSDIGAPGASQGGQGSGMGSGHGNGNQNGGGDLDDPQGTEEGLAQAQDALDALGIGTNANPTESPNYDAYDNTEDDNTTREEQERTMNTAMAIGKSRTYGRTAYQGPGKRGFSPLGYDRHEDNTISIKESTVKDFVDRVRTIRNPREKERAIKAFMEKHRMGLRQLSVKNAQDTDLGLFGMMPGVGMLNMSRNLIMGLFEKMGLTPGINSPAIDALEQEARSLGLLDKEAGEPTEGQLMQICNNTPGHKWNSETKTCEKIEFGGV